MVLAFDIHDVPASVIIECAKRLQERNGYFTSYDIFFEVFPVTRKTIGKARNPSTSRYLTWIILSAGAQSTGYKSSRRQVMYKFGGTA